MTIKDCPTCGGTHFGSITCPYASPARQLTVREWFRGMRRHPDAIYLAADIDAALTKQEGSSHIRSYNVTLIFDLAAFQAWQHKQFWIQRILE